MRTRHDFQVLGRDEGDLQVGGDPALRVPRVRPLVDRRRLDQVFVPANRAAAYMLWYSAQKRSRKNAAVSGRTPAR